MFRIEGQDTPIRPRQEHGRVVVIVLEAVMEFEAGAPPGLDVVTADFDIALSRGVGLPCGDGPEDDFAVVNDDAFILKPAPTAVVVESDQFPHRFIRGEAGRSLKGSQQDRE